MDYDIFESVLIANSGITKNEFGDYYTTDSDSAFITCDQVFIDCNATSNHSPLASDYAICNGLMYAIQSKFSTNTWVRYLSENNEAQYTNSVNELKQTSEDDYHTLFYGICPRVNLNTKKFPLDNIEKKVIDVDGFPITYINLGYNPRSFVGKSLNNALNVEFNKQNSRLKKTDIKFFTYTKNGEMTYNYAYEIDGCLAVRVEKPASKFTYINDSYKADKNTPQWFLIEPIRWETLPIKNGKNHIFLSSLETINAMPMNCVNYVPQHGFAKMWQNTMLRAFLNGYDIHKEIKKGNGNKEFKIEQNFNFENDGFLDQAFNSEIIKYKLSLSELANAVYGKQKRQQPSNKFNISIDETPMSIDEQIKFYIDNRMQFMLHGKSGIGKSRRIQDIDPDFTSIVLRNGILPEEIIGKDTTAPDGKVTWKAPFWYEQLVSKCQAKPDKTHVLFIDELTNVNEHEQSLVFDIILNNTIKPNLGKLPENCVVVSAGNSKDESNSAYNLTEPLFRRYFAHIYLPLDIPTWLEWGSQNRKKKVAIVDESTTTPESIKEKYHLTGSADKYELVDDLDEYGEPKKNIHPLVASFVGTYPKTFYSSYDADKEKEHSIDPRGWEQLSDVLYNNNGVIRKELLANKLGMQNAELFIAFAKQNFITLEDVVTGNYNISDIPTKFDAKYALALSLRYATEEELPIVRAFISEYLGVEILATYDFAWVNNNPEKAVILDDVKNSSTLPTQVELPEPTVATTNKLIKFTDFCGEREPSWTSSKTSKTTGLSFIVCRNKQEIECICDLLDSYGKKTYDNKSYTDELDYILNMAKGKPVYFSNSGSYCKFSSFDLKRRNGEITIADTYQFSEVDFSDFLSKETIKYIEEDIINKNKVIKEK